MIVKKQLFIKLSRMIKLKLCEIIVNTEMNDLVKAGM